MSFRIIEEPYYETYLQIRHQSLLFYDLPANPKSHTRHKLISPTYSGSVTDHAKKRIRKAIDLMLQLYPRKMTYNPVLDKEVSHQLSFITLTISSKEKHLSAAEGYELLLSKWLLRMRRKVGMKTYIWKAEFQKNGQLHYHITTPSLIVYSLIRDEWNNICRKAGLLSNWNPYNEKEPNSTDVHSVYKVKNLQAYLTKYISKGNKDVIKFWSQYQLSNSPNDHPHTQIESKSIIKIRAHIIKESKKLPKFKITKGKIWDCSSNLKKTKYFSIIAPSQFDLKPGSYEIKDCDRCTMYMLQNPVNILPNNIAKEYFSFLNSSREN